MLIFQNPEHIQNVCTCQGEGGEATSSYLPTLEIRLGTYLHNKPKVIPIYGRLEGIADSIETIVSTYIYCKFV